MLRTAAALAFVLSLVAVVAHATPRKIMAVADEWPPFSGTALPGRGMSLDVISTVLTRAGYEVETQVLPWARIMDGARSGQFDIVGSLFADPEIATFMTYSEPFYTTDVQFVRPRNGDFEFTSVEALRGYVIAVGEGFLYEDTFDRAGYLNKLAVTTAVQAVSMVAYGRADLTLDSVDVIEHIISVDAPTLAGRISFAPGVLASQQLHMAVRTDMDGSDEIVRDFNQTLAEMLADGSLDALLSKHVEPSRLR